MKNEKKQNKTKKESTETTQNMSEIDLHIERAHVHVILINLACMHPCMHPYERRRYLEGDGEKRVLTVELEKARAMRWLVLTR